jgi:hypothetical protein
LLPTGELFGKALPRIGHGLLEAKRDTPLAGVHFQNRHFDFLAGGYDLARMDVFLRPAHFRDVDQAFDAWFQFHERTIIGDVGDAASEL